MFVLTSVTLNIGSLNISYYLDNLVDRFNLVFFETLKVATLEITLTHR